MSRFDTDFAASGLPELMDQFGQPVTYSPVSGPDVSLTMILDPERMTEEEKGGGRVLVQRWEGTITTDPDSDFGGVASPDETATITIGGVVWSVDELAKLTGAYAVLKLVRRSSLERSRPGYRAGADR